MEGKLADAEELARRDWALTVKGPFRFAAHLRIGQ